MTALFLIVYLTYVATLIVFSCTQIIIKKVKKSTLQSNRKETYLFYLLPFACWVILFDSDISRHYQNILFIAHKSLTNVVLEPFFLAFMVGLIMLVNQHVLKKYYSEKIAITISLITSCFIAIIFALFFPGLKE